MTTPKKENLPPNPRNKTAGAVGLALITLVGVLAFVQFRGGFMPKQSLTLVADRAGLLIGPGSKVTFNGVGIGQVGSFFVLLVVLFKL